MKSFLITLLYRLALVGLLGMALSAGMMPAYASGDEHAAPAKEEAPKAAAKDEVGKGTVVQVPRRTFELSLIHI